MKNILKKTKTINTRFKLEESTDFSKSLLVGIILPVDFVPAFISQSLLFSSFIVATFLPMFVWKLK